MSGLLPVGPELGWRNRQVIAERCGWPAGALQACEAIEREHPTWYPNYREANTIPGFESPGGFYAFRRDHGDYERAAYGEDPAALLKAIEEWVRPADV